jgi:hypothetical protein
LETFLRKSIDCIVPPPKNLKLTFLNQLLTTNTTVLEAVKVGLKLPSNFTVPALGSMVLYGTLSDVMHVPPNNNVYLAKSTPYALQEFYRSVTSALFPADTAKLIFYDRELVYLQPIDTFYDSDSDSSTEPISD